MVGLTIGSTGGSSSGFDSRTLFLALLELADRGSSLEDEDIGSPAGLFEEEEDFFGFSFDGPSGIKSA